MVSPARLEPSISQIKRQGCPCSRHEGVWVEKKYNSTRCYSDVGSQHHASVGLFTGMNPGTLRPGGCACPTAGKIVSERRKICH